MFALALARTIAKRPGITVPALCAVGLHHVNRSHAYSQSTESFGTDATEEKFDWKELLANPIPSATAHLEKMTMEKWPMLEKVQTAYKVAENHFEDVPDISLAKLVQVLQLELTARNTFISDKAFIEAEFESCEAVTVEKSTFKSVVECAKLSDLAYESIRDTRSQLKSMGFELLQWHGEVGPEAPAYFIAFSPTERKVVVSIKGTNTLEDVLTDALHTPSPFLTDYHAHSGIANASTFVVNRVLPVIENLFVPLEYDIVLTGHSLGGGAAILASVTLNETYDITNRCIAIAPPPLLNKAAAEKTSEYVTSVVLDCDVIPRWNFGLVAASLHIIQRTKDVVEKKGYAASQSCFQDPNYVARKVKEDTKLYETISGSKGEQNDMFLCGKVLLLQRCEDYHYARFVPNTFSLLRSIAFSLTLLSDHSCKEYISCLQQQRFR